MRHLAFLNDDQEAMVTLSSPIRFANSVDYAPLERLKSAPFDNRRQKIGHFRILRKLGEGGMGEVFECLDERLGRHVAVKWIKPAILSCGLLDRLETEARIHARLYHPNIVSLLDFGIAEGFPYLVMEWIRGENLRTVVREAVLNPREAAMLMAEVARAIQAAHEEGVVHLDLKPANILLQPGRDESAASSALGRGGSGWIPKVSDFGLAKSVDALLDETASMLVRGTPYYMAPEQVEGKASRIGPAADIYAIGVILYELLTGRVPFSGQDFAELSEFILEKEPVAPRAIQASVPLDIQTICLKCLEKEPRHRYANAAELADDLERFAKNLPIQARPVGKIGVLWRWSLRNPLAAGLVCVTAFSIVALILGSVAFAVSQNRLRLEAEVHKRQAQANETVANERFAAMRDHLFRELDTASDNYETMRDIFLSGVHPDRVENFFNTITDQRFERARELIRRPEMLSVESESVVEAYYISAMAEQVTDQDTAITMFRKAVDRAKALAAKRPLSDRTRFYALNSANYMGVIHFQHKRAEQAIACFQEGWDHFRVRAEEAPVDYRLKRFSFMIGQNLAEDLVTAKRHAEAQAVLTECAAIERMEARDERK